VALIDRQRLESIEQERVAELRRLREQGRKVLGFVACDVPIELVRAAGAVPVWLNRGGYEAEARGERVLRSDACALCLSTAGNFDLGRSGPGSLYGVVDAVVSVNTCDMLRRLPETLLREFGLPVYELYLPRTSEPLPHRLAEFRRQLEWLRDELAALTGEEPGDSRLRRAIEETNRVRARLREFDRLRGQDTPAVAGTDILDLVRIAALLDPVPADELLAALRPVTSKPSSRRPRLMLLGSEVAWLDRWLLDLVETRADIVADLLCSGTRWFAEDCPAGDDPLADLARYYFTRLPSMTRRPNDRAYAEARQRIADRSVHGVLLKTLLYCDPWNFEAVRLHHELGRPVLAIDGNYSAENREQVRTRVEAFLENL